MATAAYNTRRRTTGIYVDGKKRNAFVRFLIKFVPWKGDSVLEIIRKFIFATALAALVYFGAPQLYLLAEVTWNDYVKERFMAKVDIPTGESSRDAQGRLIMLEEYVPHYEANNDLIGHILIPDMTSSLPEGDRNRFILNFLVYQTTNNRHYLNHNHEHSRSSAGSIFADFRHRFGNDGVLPGNTVLYGHNLFSGSMFSKVADYYKAYANRRDITYYQRHPIVQFNTLYERHDWKIFAVGLFNTKEEFGAVFPYHLIHEFPTADDFHSFVFEVMDRSVIFTDVDLTYGDHIITLSTCYWPYGEHVDTRAVVFARRVRPGESLFVDVTKATFNDNFLPFTRQQRVTGNTWVGRVWDYEKYLLSFEGDSYDLVPR
jgi:sortase B